MDFTKRVDYVPGLVEVVFIDPLPIEEGSKYVEVVVIAGRKIESTYELIEIKRNEYISVKTLSSLFPIKVDLYLKNIEGETKLALDLEFILSGPFRLASRMVGGIIRKQARDILVNIKEIIEQKKV